MVSFQVAIGGVALGPPRWIGMFIGVFGLCSASPAFGQLADEEPTAASPHAAERLAVTPPELLEFAEAEYPPLAEEQAIEGEVLLSLLITAEGAVDEARVVRGLGYGLDEAAQMAALRFRFKPAAKDGQPFAAKIHFAYEFQLPRPAVVAAAETEALTPPAAEQGSSDTQTSGAKEQADARAPAEAQVVVVGNSAADRMKKSANAVTVVELDQLKREASDLGQILARAEGVNVQRMGGLGSRARFTLGGFDDNQVRFFVDGVPIEYAGYTFGIQNVPLTTATRVDIYKGVVPVRLGADSLGGAFDLVTDHETRGTSASGSVEMGSFDTYRLALSGRHHDEKSGLFVKGEGFFDASRNDYPVEAKTTTSDNEWKDARVYRFHDKYLGYGGNVEAGVLNRSWAKKLLVRGFVTDYDKDLQNNVVMTVPYGEARYGGLDAGGSVRYEESFGQGLSGEFVAGYAFSRTDFVDVARCIYDWFGQCVNERPRGGETDVTPSDQSLWDHTGYGRLRLTWLVAPDHALRLALAPTYFTRTGDERRQLDPDARDPLTARRDLFKWINGLEYEADLFEGRLENVAFAKNYLQILQSEEPLPGDVFGVRNSQNLYWGGGDALRYEFVPWLWGKASYEYAIRLPEPEEMFGDGVLIADNLDLVPERSHNANLSLLVDDLETQLGSFDATLTGFYRLADHLIVLLGNERILTYQNVFKARSVGVEGAVAWTSPGQYVELGANSTYFDFRNASSEGAFGRYEGDRIPNQPYLFANGNARLQLRSVATAKDELSLSWCTRYVHDFYRGWESLGDRAYKQSVDAQLVHSAVLNYLVTGGPLQELSFSLNVDNITDAHVYDFFGVQKPGRAVYFKTMAVY